jgi:hypothetical protein
MPQYTDQQFNHIIEILIQYKKCCPTEDVYLNEKSIKHAFDYFMKIGIFDENFNKDE